MDLWGKLDTTGESSCHPLVCHMLDTGLVAKQVLTTTGGARRLSLLSEAFELSIDQLTRWVAFWASLHDLGKACPGFQRKGLGHPVGAALADTLGLALDTPECDHGMAGRQAVATLLSQESRPWGGSRRLAVLLATVLAGHHGRFRPAGHVDLGGPAWRSVREQLVAWLAGHFGIEHEPQPACPHTENRAAWLILAGLVSVADWVASNEKCFPPVGTSPDLQAYAVLAEARATKAIERIGWRPPSFIPGTRRFTDLFDVPAPYPMQQAIRDLSEHASEPVLLVVEAPTGLGKTEGALWAAEGWLGDGAAGLYIGLPTQTTSNQMFGRLQDYLGRMTDRQTALLLHGRARLNDEFLELLSGYAAADGADMADWFLRSKRGLLAPFAAGTVDQSLLAVLRTRHNFVRAFGLSGKVVILDEVHAYDTYTSELLKTLVGWLAQLRCSVVILSATLPRKRREELVEAFEPSACPPPPTPYPRVTAISKGRAVSETVPGGPAREVVVDVRQRDLTDVAQGLRGLLAPGGCAAWICNTVDRAQAAYDAAKAALAGYDCDVGLLHARFPFGRRKELEDYCVSRFGKSAWLDGSRPDRALLVATQVIEQSLDLDFDVMVSDLAPIDLLLQRAGRLHRHSAILDEARRRPAALSRPWLWLLTDLDCGDHVPDFGSDAWVYEPYLLLRTYRAIVSCGRTSVRTPAETEDLIEAVYGQADDDALPGEWRTALGSARDKLEAARRENECLADGATVPDAETGGLAWLDHFGRGCIDADRLEGSLAGLTRRALPSVRCICLHRVGDQLFTDPSCKHAVDLDALPDAGLLQQLALREVSLTKRTVVRHFSGIDPPKQWRKAPLLRRCHPLVSGDAIGAVRVTDDLDRGIIVEPLNKIGEDA